MVVGAVLEWVLAAGFVVAHVVTGNKGWLVGAFTAWGMTAFLLATSTSMP